MFIQFAVDDNVVSSHVMPSDENAATFVP